MEIDNTDLGHAAVQLLQVIGELHAVLGDDIAGATGAGSCVVTVFGHLIACTGDDKTARGGDVERVLAVSTGANDVDVAVAVQGDGHASLQDTVAKTQQLVHGDTTHLQTGEQGCYLLVLVLTLCNPDENALHLLATELFVVQ